MGIGFNDTGDLYSMLSVNVAKFDCMDHFESVAVVDS